MQQVQEMIKAFNKQLREDLLFDLSMDDFKLFTQAVLETENFKDPEAVFSKMRQIN